MMMDRNAIQPETEVTMGEDWADASLEVAFGADSWLFAATTWGPDAFCAECFFLMLLWEPDPPVAMDDAEESTGVASSVAAGLRASSTDGDIGGGGNEAGPAALPFCAAAASRSISSSSPLTITSLIQSLVNIVAALARL